VCSLALIFARCIRQSLTKGYIIVGKIRLRLSAKSCYTLATTTEKAATVCLSGDAEPNVFIVRHLVWRRIASVAVALQQNA
jgi:hypothetical protein